MPHWQFILVFLSLLFTAIFAAIHGYRLWKRHDGVGARPLAYLILAIASWAIAATLGDIVHLIQLDQLSNFVTPFHFQAIALIYITSVAVNSPFTEKRLRQALPLIWILSLTFIGLSLSNACHHFLWPEKTSIAQSKSLFTPLFWPIFAYNLILIGLASTQLTRLTRHLPGKDLMRSLIDNANVSVAIVQDDVIKYCNQEFASLIDYEIVEILNRPYLDFLAPDQVETARERHERRKRGLSEPTQYQTILLNRTGKRIHVEISIKEIVHNGEPALFVFGRDITPQLRAEKKLLEYARQQKLLNDITRAAIQSTNLDETLDLLADRLGELIHADNCYISLWDEATETTIPAAASGSFGQHYKAIRFPKDDITLTQVVLERGEPIIVQNYPESPYAIPAITDEFPSQSILAIPLIADQHKLGAAMIAFNEFHEFTEDEIKLGQQVSQQIGLAILKTHLLDTTRQRAIEAETLQEAGAAVVATLKLDEAIQRILEQLNRVVPYDSASVQLLHGDELEIVGQFGFANPEEVLGYRFSIHADNPNSIVIHTMQPHVLGDAPKAYEPFKHPPHNHIRGWMGVPLIVQNRIIGMLALDSHEPNRFTPEHVRMASAFAAHVAIALENARLYEDTHRLAITDPLIGIFNRRHFMELARREHQRALRYQRSISIIMMDIDHFKRVNDTYGHLIGDQVLRATALLCQDHLRETDIIGRYGGEEFVMLLPETNDTTDKNSSSLKVAERLRHVIANTPIKTERGDIAITISLGIVDLTSAGEDIEVLLDRADQALYIAKQTGRNRVVVWSPDLPSIEENAKRSH